MRIVILLALVCAVAEAKPAPCPAVGDLAQIAAQAQDSKWPLSLKAVKARCAIVRTPEPRWLIVADLPYTPDGNIFQIDIVVLVDPTTKKVVATTAPEEHGGYMENLTLIPVDFDGDGTDEALIESGPLTKLQVLRFDEGTPVLGRGFDVGWYEDVTYAVAAAGKRKVVEVAVHESKERGGLAAHVDPPLAVGKHVFELRDGELVEKR